MMVLGMKAAPRSPDLITHVAVHKNDSAYGNRLPDAIENDLPRSPRRRFAGRFQLGRYNVDWPANCKTALIQRASTQPPRGSSGLDLETSALMMPSV